MTSAKKEREELQKFKRVSKDRVDPEATKTMVSIRLDNHIIAGLKDEAERTGVPYQTLLSSILHMYLTGQLIDKKNNFRETDLDSEKIVIKRSVLG